MHLSLLARAALTMPLLAPHAGRNVHAFLVAMAREGSVYDPEPTDTNAPLTEKTVLNPYWRAVKEGSQEKKEAALALIEQSCSPFIDRDKPPYSAHRKIAKSGDSHWYFQTYELGQTLAHYHIAAAILAGTRLPKTQLGSDLLGASVDRGYGHAAELARLLLRHGTNPNGLCFIDTPHEKPLTPLMCAHKVDMARLLVEHGASTAISQHQPSLLNIAASKAGRDGLELMSFYLARGASPLEQDHVGDNCLHEWLRAGWCPFGGGYNVENTLKGTDILLANLTPAEVVRLFSTRNKSGFTPLDMLTYDEKGWAASYDPMPRVDEVREPLMARLSAAWASAGHGQFSPQQFSSPKSERLAAIRQAIIERVKEEFGYK